MSPALSPAARHLARLLGYPPRANLTDADLAAAALYDPDRVAAGLVAEALTSDDVTSGGEARAFVEERLAEWAELLEAAVRDRIAGAASAEIQRRAPETGAPPSAGN